MGNRKTKVESMGLGPQIEKMMLTGISARRIAARIQAEHPDIDISDSAVIRYVGKARKEATDEAFETIRKHVDVVIPEDLKALEEMEAQCLVWVREAGRDRIERIAEAAYEIKGKIDEWVDRFLMYAEKRDDAARDILIRKIIRECIELMAREDRLQAERDKAMNTAIKIIDLKLRQAGLLDEEGKGRIVIVDRTQEMPKGDDGKGYTPFVVKGGKPMEAAPARSEASGSWADKGFKKGDSERGVLSN